MICELLDFRCIFMNELIGSTILTVLLAAVVYFVVASKSKLGFDTTVTFAFPLILIVGLTFTGFSVIFAFATIIIGLIFAAFYNRILNN